MLILLIALAHGGVAFECCSTWCPANKDDSTEYCDFCCDNNFPAACDCDRGGYSGDALCDTSSPCYNPPSPPQATYVEGVADDECSGDTALTSEIDCEAAATSLSYGYSNANTWQSSSAWIPLGCSVNVEESVAYFNDAESGSANSIYAPLCVGSTVPPSLRRAR